MPDKRESKRELYDLCRTLQGDIPDFQFISSGIQQLFAAWVLRDREETVRLERVLVKSLAKSPLQSSHRNT